MEGVFRVVFLAGSGAACIVSAFLDVLAFEVVAVFFADFLDAVVFLAAVVLETVTFSAVSDMAVSFTAVVFLAPDEAVFFAAVAFRAVVFFRGAASEAAFSSGFTASSS